MMTNDNYEEFKVILESIYSNQNLILEKINYANERIDNIEKIIETLDDKIENISSDVVTLFN